jgi:hypothetical protein
MRILKKIEEDGKIKEGGKIEEVRGCIGEDARLQLGKNAIDPTFLKSTILVGDLLAEMSLTE